MIHARRSPKAAQDYLREKAQEAKLPTDVSPELYAQFWPVGEHEQDLWPVEDGPQFQPMP